MEHCRYRAVAVPSSPGARGAIAGVPSAAILSDMSRAPAAALSIFRDVPVSLDWTGLQRPLPSLSLPSSTLYANCSNYSAIVNNDNRLPPTTAAMTRIR